jgi:hypothetical protein
MNINTSDPFWVELDRRVFLLDETLTIHNWTDFIDTFTKNDMVRFLDLCPNIKHYQYNAILGAIMHNNTERCCNKRSTHDIFRDMYELWDYDFTTGDHIDECLIFKIKNIEVYKFLLDCGCAFKKEHAARVDMSDSNMVNLMLEYGLDVNDLADAIIKKSFSMHRKLFQQLRLLAELNVDITGHILDLPKSNPN